MSLEMNIDDLRYLWQVMEDEGMYLNGKEYERHLQIQRQIEEEVVKLATEGREWVTPKREG